MRANETLAMFMPEDRAREDRKLFVQNLGELLTQTRDGVERCYLDDKEIVHIVYKQGGEHTVNVHMDSYAAIVRDVSKYVQ